MEKILSLWWEKWVVKGKTVSCPLDMATREALIQQGGESFPVRLENGQRLIELERQTL